MLIGQLDEEQLFHLYFCLNSVALNFQTPHKEMHVNQGRFRPNGFCGYILKPEFLRSLSSQFNPKALTKGPWLQKKTFHIMVREELRNKTHFLA